MTLTSIKDLIKNGLDTVILSMMQPNILKMYLEGKTVSATKLVS